MRRHRGIPTILAVGALFVVAALLWRQQILAFRQARAAQRQQARAHAFVPRPPREPAPPEIWRPAPAGERRAAIRSIEAQLDAFRAGDYERAARYQSSALQANFPSLTAFRVMMEATYPQFAHSRSARFGPARMHPQGGRIAIPVTVTGDDGMRVQAGYLMIRERGVYRVESVFGGASPDERPRAIL